MHYTTTVGDYDYNRDEESVETSFQWLAAKMMNEMGQDRVI